MVQGAVNGIVVPYGTPGTVTSNRRVQDEYRRVPKLHRSRPRTAASSKHKDSGIKSPARPSALTGLGCNAILENEGIFVHRVDDQTAAEQEGDNLKRSEELHLKARTRV